MIKYIHLRKDEESECDRACPETFDVPDTILVDNKGAELGVDLHQYSPVPESLALGSTNHS